MARLEMKGPYDLTAASVEVNVTKSQTGNYALGKKNDKDLFVVSYVGRSDDDLPGRIKDHLDEHPLFKFSYADSVQAAFEKECTNYHDFSPPGNKAHPARPAGKTWPCPVASCKE